MERFFVRMSSRQGGSDPPVVRHYEEISYETNSGSKVSDPAEMESDIRIDSEEDIQGQYQYHIARNVNIEKNEQKNKKPTILYTYKCKGPFEVLVEAKNESNIGNLHSLAIAKKIFDLKIEDIGKINRRGKTELGLTSKILKQQTILLRI